MLSRIHALAAAFDYKAPWVTFNAQAIWPAQVDAFPITIMARSREE